MIFYTFCFAENDTLTYKDTDEYLMIFLRPHKFYAQSAYELVSKQLKVF